MEVSIEFKKFAFNTLVRSVLFRVQEISKRRRETVDLKIHVAVWVVPSLRSICSEGFGVGVRKSKHFHGRRFSISCKMNSACTFVALEIFGATRKLKDVLIPAGECCIGLHRFTDALARTTAGPIKPVQVPVARLQSPLICDAPVSSSSEHRWISIWGFNCHHWDLKVISDLMILVPRIICILSVIGKEFGIIAKIEGGMEGLPEVVRLEVKGQMISVFLCPERPQSFLELIGVGGSDDGTLAGSGVVLEHVEPLLSEENIAVAAAARERGEAVSVNRESFEIGNGRLVSEGIIERQGEKHVAEGISQEKLYMGCLIQSTETINRQPNFGTCGAIGFRGSAELRGTGGDWISGPYGFRQIA